MCRRNKRLYHSSISTKRKFEIACVNSLIRFTRFKELRMKSMIGILVLALGTHVQATSPTTTELYQIEKNILKKTNDARRRHGRAPLTLDHGLLQSARRHGIWMARHRSMRHSNDRVAENVAMGQSSSTEVINDWLRSPGHRANMLNSQYSRIGIAAYRGQDGNIYWCQQFLR